MPSGEVHLKYWKLIGLPTAILTCILIGSIALVLRIANYLTFLEYAYAFEYLLWYGFWFLMTLYIDPDLDQVTITKAEGRAIRKFGIIGDLFFAYWSFYAASMNRLAKLLKVNGVFGAHGTWITHSLVPGTMIRMVFINIPIGTLTNLANIGFGPLDILVFLAAQFHGLGTGDVLHIILDKTNGD